MQLRHEAGEVRFYEVTGGKKRGQVGRKAALFFLSPYNAY
jgi:hypothetical protein